MTNATPTTPPTSSSSAAASPSLHPRPTPFFAPPLPGDTPLDPDSAFVTPARALTLAPLLSETLRRRHHAFIAGGHRFASSARLLAALWRRDHDLPAGTHTETDAKGKTRRTEAGWLLRRDAAQAGATFLSSDIRACAREALLLREPGAMWNEARLWGNLLSSQALTLNLLAPLALDLTLATKVWRQLLPGFVDQVTRIRFEHSPGRFDDAYFGDGTALDAIIEGVTPDGEVAVITIEVKFIEGLIGPSATPRPPYTEAAQASGLYKDPNSLTLARPGFEQLRREHTMTDLMLRHGLASRGRFVLIAPALNRRAQAVAKLYAAELADPAGPNDPTTVGFVNLTLEQLLSALADAGAHDHARRLFERYCDHSRVAQCALEDDGSLPTPPATPASSSPRPSSSTPDTLDAKPSRLLGAARSKASSHPPTSKRQRSTGTLSRAAEEVR